MGQSLLSGFLYLLAVGVFVAYINEPRAPARLAVSRGLPIRGLHGVHRVLGGALAGFDWYKRKWSTTIKNTIDGFI